MHPERKVRPSASRWAGRTKRRVRPVRPNPYIMRDALKGHISINDLEVVRPSGSYPRDALGTHQNRGASLRPNI